MGKRNNDTDKLCRTMVLRFIITVEPLSRPDHDAMVKFFSSQPRELCDFYIAQRFLAKRELLQARIQDTWDAWNKCQHNVPETMRQIWQAPQSVTDNDLKGILEPVRVDGAYLMRMQSSIQHAGTGVVMSGTLKKNRKIADYREAAVQYAGGPSSTRLQLRNGAVVHHPEGVNIACKFNKSAPNNKRRKMAKDSPITNVTSIINADLKLGQNGGFHTRGRNVKGVRELTVAYGPSFKV